MEDKVNRRQMLSLAFVSVLSPLARRFPSSLVMLSGSAAYLAPIIAAPILALLVAAWARLLRRGRDLGGVLEQSLGKGLGRLTIYIIGIWLIFYSAFILRAAAYRFAATAYPGTSPWIFIVISAAVCLPMAAGKFSALCRMSVLIKPLLLAALGLVFLFAMVDGHFEGMFAVTRVDALPVAKSTLTVVNTLSVVGYLAFAEGHCRDDFRPKRWLWWAAIGLAITEMLCLSCLGVFGAELTGKLNYPFFMLVRDISIFNSFARMEALVIALWIFTDLVHVSLLLHIARGNLSRGNDGRAKALPIICCALAAAAALLMPGDMLGVGLFSEKVIPIGNAVILFGLLPIAVVIGLVRKRI